MTFAAQATLTWALLVAVSALVVAPAWWWRHRRRAVRVDVPGAAATPHADATPDRAMGDEPTTEDTAATTGRPSLRPMGIAAAVLLLNGLLLRTPSVGPFTDLAWNWQGKLLALAASLLLVAAWPGLRRRDVGLTLPPARAWQPVLMLGVSVVVVFAVLGAGLDDRGRFGETLLFQATMPGLEEELLFRGILWALIDRALPGRRRLWGAPVGWALVVTTLLFGLAHGISVDAQLGVGFDLAPVVSTGMVGVVLGWLRARSGSILPAIVLHNVINVALLLVP